MTKVEIATADQIRALCGGIVPVRMTAYSVTDGDDLLAIFGLEHHKGYKVAFSNIATDADRHRKQVVKCGRILVEMIKQSIVPVYAVRSKDHATADRLLRHFGFVPHNNEVYLWRRQQQ